MTAVPADFVAKIEAYATHFDSLSPWAAAIASVTLLDPRLCGRGSRCKSATPSFVVADRHDGGRAARETSGRDDRLAIRRDRRVVSGAALAGDRAARCLAPRRARVCDRDARRHRVAAVPAVVADGMIGGRHRSNMELVAQGIANVVTPLFGGIPATGAIARTATNIKAGGRTPVAGIVHSITLLLITLFFGRWAALIPMATLAGILVVVAVSHRASGEPSAECLQPRSGTSRSCSSPSASPCSLTSPSRSASEWYSRRSCSCARWPRSHRSRR